MKKAEVIRMIRYHAMPGLSRDLGNINISDLHAYIAHSLQNIGIITLDDWRRMNKTEECASVVIYNPRVRRNRRSNVYPIIRIDLDATGDMAGVVRTPRVAKMAGISLGAHTTCVCCPLSLMCRGGADVSYFRSGKDSSVSVNVMIPTDSRCRLLKDHMYFIALKSAMRRVHVPKDCPGAEPVGSPLMKYSYGCGRRNYSVLHPPHGLVVSVSSTNKVF